MACYFCMSCELPSHTGPPPGTANVGSGGKPANTCRAAITATQTPSTGIRPDINIEYAQTRTHITNEFNRHRPEFWVDFLFVQHIAKALMMMHEQITVAALQHTFAVGSFLDAKNQMEAQRLFQTLAARAHKDYRPDVGMCTFGTLARGLGASSRNAEITALMLDRWQMDRMFNRRGSSAYGSEDTDKAARVRQVIGRFCHMEDNNRDMGSLCGNGPASNEGVNRDVDFTRTVLTPMTLNVNLTDNASTGDEADVLGLAANLYAHDVFRFIAGPATTGVGGDGINYLLDMRAVAAKRGVAMHSFNSIVGMKAAGSETSEQTAPYLRTVLQQLGINANDAGRLIGPRPSYDAQMEVLTRKIYQQPEFYTDLYTSPVNIERKAATLQAFRLMQDMDRFKSGLRSEMLLSMLLELSVEEEQGRVRDLIQGLGTPDLGAQ